MINNLNQESVKWAGRRSKQVSPKLLDNPNPNPRVLDGHQLTRKLPTTRNLSQDQNTLYQPSSNISQTISRLYDEAVNALPSNGKTINDYIVAEEARLISKNLPRVIK